MNERFSIAIRWAITVLAMIFVGVGIGQVFRGLALPFILADMFTGFSIAFALALAQRALIQGIRQRDLRQWLTFNVVGGIVGALAGGALSVYQFSLINMDMVPAIPFLFIFLGIGIAQQQYFGAERQRLRGWSLLHALPGLAAGWLTLFTPFSLILAVIGAGLLGRQMAQSEIILPKRKEKEQTETAAQRSVQDEARQADAAAKHLADQSTVEDQSDFASADRSETKQENR